MSKPLVFAEANQPKSSGPKPLDFGNVLPAQSSSKIPVPAANSSHPSLSFPTTPTTTKHLREPVNPTPLFGSSSSPLTGDAIKLIKDQYGALYRSDTARIEMQVSQLLPLRVEVLVAWGSKTLERMRASATESSKLVMTFSTVDGNAALENVVKAMKTQPGLMGRLKKQDPTIYEPQLSALLSTLPMWTQQCSAALEQAKKNHHDMMIKMATLSAVCDTVGQPPDQLLAQTLHNRRIMMQQGTFQAELLIKQLEDTYNQLMDQQMRADQVLNITLPAWKAARATR